MKSTQQLIAPECPTPEKLALPEVTLCCIDTANPNLALIAIEKCLSAANFGAAILVTSKGHNLNNPASNLQILEIDTIRDIESYSHFLIKSLNDLIETRHALIVQWDGFIKNPQAWDPQFLEYDYIGAVWPQFKDEMVVGNGGFSLRSKRLMSALTDPLIVASNPEDECIARKYRTYLEEKHHIRFATKDIADRFSQERSKSQGPSFGFHGLTRLADALNSEELQSLIDNSRDSIFSSTEARGFIKTMIRRGKFKEAETALRKRIISNKKSTLKIKLGNLRLEISLSLNKIKSWNR